MRSIRARLLALAAVWIAVALMAAFLVIGGLLNRFVSERYDAELQAVADGLLAGITLSDSPPRLASPPADPRFWAPQSGWYWQLRLGDRVIAKSPSLFDSHLRSRDAPDHGRGRGPAGEPLRVLAQTVTLPGHDAPLQIIVTAPARQIWDSIHQLRGPVALSLIVLGLGLGLAVAVQVHVGLRSLRMLGADLRRVRRGEATRLPAPNAAELDALVSEINAALDHNETLLARARQHLGNLAHALKTPLAALANDLPADAPAQALIARMDRLIGWHLRRARMARPGNLGTATPVAPVIDDILMVLRGPLADAGITVDIDCPPGTTLAADRHDIEEIIGNLAENAAKWGRSRIRITARPTLIRIEDDGPGMAQADTARAVIRGARLDETGPAGSGLGLAIVADLAALHGGRLDLGRADLGGLRAEVTLPAHPATG